MKFTGGFKQLSMVHFIMIMFTVFKVSADYLVGSWALAEDQHSRFWYYCGTYFGFTIATSLCVAARIATL